MYFSHFFAKFIIAPDSRFLAGKIFFMLKSVSSIYPNIPCKVPCGCVHAVHPSCAIKFGRKCVICEAFTFHFMNDKGMSRKRLGKLLDYSEASKNPSGVEKHQLLLPIQPRSFNNDE